MKTGYTLTRFSFASILSFGIIVLIGCGTTSVGKLSTPSGRPEVVIPNSNVQSVMDGVAAWLASQGKPIDATGVYTISTSFTKPENVLGISVDHGYSSVFTIVPNGTNTSIYGTTYDHRNNNELTEQTEYEDMQKELTQISEFLKTRE
ncbi:MAG: hypothetical protein ACHQM6_10830 [Candidatus Kapaibacterium sp.]